jgi:hypothetical protein
MSANNILAAVVNYDHNPQAVHLKKQLSAAFDTIIIDSGSPVQLDEFDIKLENVGYSGLFNAAAAQTIAQDYEWLFLICSDVTIRSEDVRPLRSYMNQLGEDIGVYSPSASGRCHAHCRNAATVGLRDVLYVEGYTFLARRSILDKVYPVDLELNRLGWGLDVCKGYACKTAGLRCVVDDRITVHHETGTGYSTKAARSQMLAWMDSSPLDGLRGFWNEAERCLGL